MDNPENLENIKNIENINKDKNLKNEGLFLIYNFEDNFNLHKNLIKKLVYDF
jgi:hypothetical protein